MRALGWILTLTLLSAPAFAQGWRERFVDPEDGGLDASNYLLDYRGVLPAPIIITEPAVGYGGGVALLWFTESMREAAAQAQRSGGRITPPNIYAAAFVGTENGTRGALGAARMSFAQDTWRYRGVLGLTSINLDFHGVGGTLQSGLDKVGYNLKGIVTWHEVTRRLGESDQWLGLRLIYLDLKNRLDFGTTADAGLGERETGRKGSGLGFTAVHDSRDNIFTPRTGVEASLDGMFYSPGIGSDTTFQAWRTHAFGYLPVGENATLALRADARTTHGDVPFYQLPFIELRGVPAARYQDQSTGVLEVEGRYYVTPRWIAIAFVGAGRAWGRNTSFSDEGTVVTRGVGFRYMLARRLGLSIGLDVARGPEETAYYLQVGNAWR
jgi:hypothetical protein